MSDVISNHASDVHQVPAAPPSLRIGLQAPALALTEHT
jgi:hypothetical protein